LGPLRRTIGVLQEALFASQNRAADESLRMLLRDATIQRFAFTFEVAWKTLKRFLEDARFLLAQLEQRLGEDDRSPHA
jgi:hypothetical protein